MTKCQNAGTEDLVTRTLNSHSALPHCSFAFFFAANSRSVYVSCFALRRCEACGWRSWARARGVRAAAAGVGNHLLVIARLADRLVGYRLEPGGGPPLVDLAGNGRLAIAQPRQPLVADRPPAAGRRTRL